MQKKIEDLIEQAALKFNLPKQVIDAIHDNQGRLMRQLVKESRKNGLEEELPTIFLIKLGKLYPNMIKHNKIKEFIINKNNGEQSAESTQE